MLDNRFLIFRRITQTAKWLIQQNIILTPFYGALGVLLKSDGKLYSSDVSKQFWAVKLPLHPFYDYNSGFVTQGVSASVILTALNAIATLMCMYGFKLISELAKKIEGKSITTSCLACEFQK